MKKPEYILEKEIEILAHKQEEHKFNFQSNSNVIFNNNQVTTGIFVPVIMGGFALSFSPYPIIGLIVLILGIVGYFLTLYFWNNKPNKIIDQIRKAYWNNVEEMKKRYIKLGVNLAEILEKKPN